MANRSLIIEFDYSGEACLVLSSVRDVYANALANVPPDLTQMRRHIERRVAELDGLLAEAQFDLECEEFLATGSGTA